MIETFHDAWARCAPWLEAALARAPLTHTLDDVRAAVAEGRAQFWAFPRSAAVTEILDAPRSRTLNHWLVGGDLDEIVALQPHVERWAKANGCTRLMLGGRGGWARVLGPRGFSPAGLVLTKELTKESI
jgi:hypothetical protein